MGDTASSWGSDVPTEEVVRRQGLLRPDPSVFGLVVRSAGRCFQTGGKANRTTLSDPQVPKPSELVGRNFRPLAPDRLWVADFTYRSTGRTGDS